MTSLSSANENSMNYASLAFAKSTKILVEEDLSETLLNKWIEENIHFMWNPLLPMPPKIWHNNSFLGSVVCNMHCKTIKNCQFHGLLTFSGGYFWLRKMANKFIFLLLKIGKNWLRRFMQPTKLRTFIYRTRHYKPRLVYFFTTFLKTIYVLWPLALCMACIQERLLI